MWNFVEYSFQLTFVLQIKVTIWLCRIHQFRYMYLRCNNWYETETCWGVKYMWQTLHSSRKVSTDENQQINIRQVLNDIFRRLNYCIPTSLTIVVWSISNMSDHKISSGDNLELNNGAFNKCPINAIYTCTWSQSQISKIFCLWKSTPILNLKIHMKFTSLITKM